MCPVRAIFWISAAGTGLIALMLAQRSEAHIMAVDIDEDAVKQAKENVEKSPWPGRIEVERHDICCFNSDIRYDVIVSNPPYFFQFSEMS